MFKFFKLKAPIGSSMVIITWGLNAQRPDKGVYVDVDKHLIKKTSR